jgi:hypothetical protein
MMFYAKRIVQAVGGKPEGIALQNDGRTHYFGLDPTQKVEHLVINFEQFLSKFIYTSVSNVSSPTEELEKNVETAFAQVPQLLRQYREEYRIILTLPDD